MCIRDSLLEHQPVGIDQELLRRARYACADVGEDQVVPAEQRDQAVGGGQVDTLAPFLGAELVAAIGQVERG